MPAFAYRARTADGQEVRGRVDAADAAAVAPMLRARGLMALEAEPVAARGGRDGGAGGAGVSLWNRPRSVTIEVALQQMSVMLRSGLTLLESLRTTAQQTRSPVMRRVLSETARQIQLGRSLYDAMADQRVFGEMVLQLIRVGEQTGSLETVMARAAEALERRRLLRTQLVNAMMYPAIVLVAAIGVTVFMLVFAIPRIANYLNVLGRDLPAMTQVLVDTSNFLLVWWPLLLAGLGVLGGLVTAVYMTPPGRLFIDRLLLRLPLLGYILRVASTAGLARALAMLLGSGVTLVQSLRTTELLRGNREQVRVLAEARQRVIRGEPLAACLEGEQAFMPMLASMVAIGERSGDLEHVLGEAAAFHEQRLDALIRTLSTLIEIVTILVVGGIVGYVYIAFIMALYGAAG